MSTNKAGPELDALVAEFLGWRLDTGYPVGLWVGPDEVLTGWCDSDWPDEGDWGDAPELFSGNGVWRPSTDIAAAWVVVDMLRQMQFIVRLSIPNGQFGWRPQVWGLAVWKNVHRDTGMTVENCATTPYEFYKELSFEAESDSAPLAICLVALQVGESQKRAV